MKEPEILIPGSFVYSFGVCPIERSVNAGNHQFMSDYSTVTDFARFLGLSTSSPLPRAT
jgi:hypothetical protein